MRTFGKIVKYAAIAVALVFIVVLGVRMAMTANRRILADIHPTENACTAYEKDGKDAFLTHKLPAEISEDGYFTAYALSYSPATEELQITVRYNQSLYEKYLPGSDPDKYYFELRDSEGETVAKGKRLCEKELYFYEHLRIAFEGITLDEESELYLFLCDDESEYPADHTKGIILHHPSFPFKGVSLSKEVKEALANTDN